jgi:hypothetical protein
LGTRKTDNVEFLKTIAIIVGVMVSVIGIMGGIFSLPNSYRRFRKGFYPHGEKGTGSIVLSKKIINERQFVTFLVIEDIFQFIKAFLQPKEWGGEFESIEKIGEYYKIVISYPKEKEFNFYITKGNKK